MGRHSAGGGLPYFLSFALWAVPWVVLACLVGFGIWSAVNNVGGGEITVQSSPTRSPSPRPSKTQPEPTPVPERTPTPKPTPQEPTPEENTPEPDDEGDRNGGTGLHAAGVTVQVINGTGGIEGAAEAMADQLARLGYTVEAFTTGLTVDQSLVLYSSPELSDEAVALAGYLGFIAGPAPAELSPDIDLHVIVSAADV